jgi:RNA recognition motif-containing protein
MRVREDLLFLVRERCVVAEHLRADQLDDEELVRITAAGTVHLQLMANPDYLAACAEDTWVSDKVLAGRVADRLRRGPQVQFARSTTARTASEFVDYLKERGGERLARPSAYLSDDVKVDIETLGEAEAAIAASRIYVSPRIYVGGLAPNATEQDLQRAFEAAGFSPRRIVLPRERGAEDRNRGYAFVDMDDGPAALRVLDAEDTLRLNGRQLRIAEAHAPTEFAGSRRVRSDSRGVSDRVYVGNLAKGVTERTLREAFATHGLAVLAMEIPLDRGTGQPRGFGFVTVRSSEEAQRAIGALNGTPLLGQPVVVRPANARKVRDSG